MSAPPQTDLVATIVQNVRALRKVRGWSAQALADRMTEAGCPMERTVLTNLETGRRSNVSVDELWTLSGLFGMPPEQLAISMCQVCHGAPPPGFICGSCRATNAITDAVPGSSPVAGVEPVEGK